MNSDFVAWRHKLKCPAKHPPGDEIYRHESVSIFEVDGRKSPVYCQNLCLLAKLFLGSKTLYYDVEPFLFYIMTEYDVYGCHFVGYFSKEKRPSSANNVSCILTLPIHQRKGYGNLLIDFSYLLTRIEGKTGSPEKPLSDMGLVSYRNYWRLILSYQLRNQKMPVSIAELTERTGMTPDDIVSALEGLRALVRDPVTKTYALRLDNAYFEECIQNWESKGYVGLNPDALLWAPYIMGQGNQVPLHAVAQREGTEEDEKDEELETAQIEGVQAATLSVSENGDVPMITTNGHSPAESSLLLLPPPPPPPPARSPAAAAAILGNATPTITSTNPAAGIPPARFEIWPPVQAAPPVKRRPGRPFGTTRVNMNLRNGITSPAPRPSPLQEAESLLTPNGTRRGRIFKPIESPAVPTVAPEKAVSASKDTEEIQNGDAAGENNANEERQNNEAEEQGSEKVMPSTPPIMNGQGRETRSKVTRSAGKKLDAGADGEVS